MIKSDAATKEKKAELVSKLTNVLEDVLNKKPETTHVIIKEIEAEDWAVAGVLLSEKK
jgi:4-oxalocrotonate tautomerase